MLSLARAVTEFLKRFRSRPADLSAAARMEISAIIDRMVYGNADALALEDATRLFDLVKATPEGWAICSAHWHRHGSSFRGYAAGMGNVELREAAQHDTLFDLSSPHLRAGQWKIRRQREHWLADPIRMLRRGFAPPSHSIEITQFLQTADGAGETKIWLEYDHGGSPLCYWIYQYSEIKIGLPLLSVAIRLVMARPVPWKSVSGGAGVSRPGPYRSYHLIAERA